MMTLFTLVVAIQVITALVIIGLVLVQHGKGADMGAAFGSGASGSLFGATGSSSFLSRATAVTATLFFTATLALAYLGNRHTASSGGVMDNLTAPATKPATKANDIPATSSATGVTQPQSRSQPANAQEAPATAGSPNRVDQIPK